MELRFRVFYILFCLVLLVIYCESICWHVFLIILFQRENLKYSAENKDTESDFVFNFKCRKLCLLFESKSHPLHCTEMLSAMENKHFIKRLPKFILTLNILWIFSIESEKTYTLLLI